MYEKVNPKHPDKIADRIAGALVDLAYDKKENPHVAVEVLIGHGKCHIINETDTPLDNKDVLAAVKRITESDTIAVDYVEVPQDPILNENQSVGIRCGDNGIFKGCPVTKEQKELAIIAYALYDLCNSDGKYILDGKKFVVCQSKVNAEKRREIDRWNKLRYDIEMNPLGDWTGGTDVDTGATNRKLGSDMGEAVTGGGLHGKDLSKADVSVNLYLHKLAQEDGRVHTARCTIGDSVVIVDGKGVSFSRIVNEAREYINDNYDGMFEDLADWGLIDPYVI